MQYSGKRDHKKIGSENGDLILLTSICLYFYALNTDIYKQRRPSAVETVTTGGEPEILEGAICRVYPLVPNGSFRNRFIAKAPENSIY